MNANLKIKPMPGYLVIKPLQAEARTSSGIYLPDNASEKPQKGEVLAVGAPEIDERGVKRPSPVKKGDVVIYKKWGGNEIKIGNTEYLLTKFEDIMAQEI